MPVQELFSFSDLPAVDSSPTAVRQKFQDTFGKNPDGICVNSETYFNAVKPAITQQYGHPCYKALGVFEYQEAASQPPQSAIVGSNYAINNGSEEAQISLTVDGSWSEETSWSSSTTTGLTISEEFTIEGVFKLGASFSVSTTVGESKSNTVAKSSSASVTVTVPPKSKKKIQMVGTLQEEAMNFQAPIAVQGMFGANFPDRVQGHYFWFLSAGQVLPQTTGEIQGTIKHTAVFNVQTEIGETEPLT